MPNEGQKTPIARTLNRFAEQKVQSAIKLLGKSLPASVVSVQGSIVEVRFEIASTPNSPFTLPSTLTVPVAGSEYIRLPIQPGCLGWVMSADAYLGGMSGLGGGVADLSLHANLSCLVWSPIGNANWSDPTDPNSTEIYGPNGVILRDADKKTVFTLTAGGVTIDLQAGDAVTINGKLIVNGDLLLGGGITAPDGSTYAGNLHTSGGVVSGFGTGDQVTLGTHTHPGNNDPPTPGT